MTKLLFTLLLISTVPTGSCKKQTEYCWLCEDAQGNEYDQMCGKTEDEINKLTDQGWHCTKK